MFGFTLQFDDQATEAGQALADKLRSSIDIAVAAAESLADLIRAHLKNLEDTRPNKMGWPRTHFWADAYKDVQNPTRRVDGAAVALTNPGLAQRYFGGEIVPHGHPFLAIPARAEAYGHNPRDFDNLVPIITGPGRGELIEAEAQRVSFGRKKKDGTRTVKEGEEVGGLAMFWLVDKVHQDPDPSVLPTEEKMSDAVQHGAQTRIDRIVRGEE